MEPIVIQPATPDRWGDLVAVFGRRGEDPSWDWCQLFVRPRPGPVVGPADNREALRGEIGRASVAPGLIAYVDGHPAGWTRVGPRSGFPGIVQNRALAPMFGAEADDRGVWWVTCFAVERGHRRAGVGLALLKAAAQFAHDHGAVAVVGHPVDVAALKASRVGAAALYPGTVAMFAAAGFVEVGRTSAARPVMRRDL